MAADRDTQQLLRLALGAWVVAGAVGGIELWAHQSPGTPYYLGVLPGPISALRETLTLVGVFLATLTAAKPAAYPGAMPRGLWLLLYASLLVIFASFTYGAAMGLAGTQLRDMRPTATPLFIGKYLGLAGLWAVAVAFARGLLGRV